MKTKISITAFLMLWLVTISVKGQSPLFTYITDINSNIASIPYIFEGQIQSVEIFAGDEYGNPLTTGDIVWNGDVGYWYDPTSGQQGFGYSLATIKVCKVFKGEIETNEDHFFQVLTRCYALNNVYRFYDAVAATTQDKYVYLPAKHTIYGKQNEKVFLPADAYPKQIFFCDQIDPIVGSSYVGQQYHSNFHTLYEMAYNVPVSIPQADGSSIFMNSYCTLFNYIFSDASELVTFLSAISGVNPSPENWCEGSSRNAEAIEEIPAIITSGNKERHEKYMAELKAKSKLMIQNQPSTGNKVMADDLTLDIANERLVAVGATKWLEFDIMASSNNSKYLDNCVMRLQYNSSVFGASVATNNNIQITRSTPFNTNSYTNPNTIVWDFSSNAVTVAFGSNNAQVPLNRVQITGTPALMLTIRMKIQTCGQGMGISFTDVATTAISCWFSNAANSTWSVSSFYNTVTYNGSINDISCQPIINSFTSPLAAGIGNQMTITGKYFGTQMKTGTVIFKDADAGTIYPHYIMGAHSSGIQPYDVVSWADNQIVLKLPSVIDSAYAYLTTTLGLVPYGPTQVYPGTGKFLVQNFTGTRAESTSPVTITFSHLNVIAPNTQSPVGPYRKKPVKIAGPTATAYRVQVDPAVSTYDPKMKSAIKRGMKDWACVTWINWYMGADTAIGTVTPDFVNQVEMGPSNMDPTELITTKVATGACGSGGTETWFVASFDIIINPNPPQPWWVDTTGATLPANRYDFFQTASHELGHAHALFHINDSLTELMFWRQDWFASSGGYRKNVYSSFGGVTGGQYIANNLVGGLTCITNNLLITPSNCTGSPPNGINEINTNLINLAVSPNPSAMEESINITFNLEKEQMISFRLYGVAGNLIKETTPKKLDQSVSYEFNTCNVSAGLYLLAIQVGQHVQTVKIIKQ